MDKFDDIFKILKEYSFEIDETNKDYLCIICNNILSNAHSSPCGCRFCYDCICKLLNGEEKFCPGDTNECKQEKLNLNKNIHYEPSVNTRISKLIVKCPNKCCKFKDEIRNIENHIRQCNFRQINCLYFNIGCKQSNLINDNMKNHFLDDIVPHSNLLLELIENMRNEMELLKKDIGELKDGNKLLKNENKSLKDEIEMIKLDRNVNQIKISELERKEKMNNDEIVELNKKMMELKNGNRYLKDEIKMMKINNTNKNMENTIETIKTNSEQQTVAIDKIKMKMMENNQNKFDEVSNRNATLNRKLNEVIKKTQTNDLQIKISETRGEFEWKIDDFSKLERNKQICSEPFYAFPNGYKMCLSIIIGQLLNSVYLHLIKGKFDDDLIWPCKCDVRIDLINQNNNEIFKSEIKKYNNQLNYSQWNKPTSERKNQTKIPFIFVPDIEKLLKNDQLLIKCRTFRDATNESPILHFNSNLQKELFQFNTNSSNRSSLPGSRTGTRRISTIQRKLK